MNLHDVHRGIEKKNLWTYLSFTPCFIANLLGQVWVVGDQEVIEDGARLHLR